MLGRSSMRVFFLKCGCSIFVKKYLDSTSARALITVSILTHDKSEFALSKLQRATADTELAAN